MSINQNEIFYGTRAYDPPLWYPGYDKNWVLGRRALPFPQKDNKQGKEEQKPKGIIELQMPLCCNGCVEKVKTKLIDIEGVTSVECSTELQKVTVKGEAKPESVLARAKRIMPRTEFWKDNKKK